MMDGFKGKSFFLLANTSLPANRRRSTAFLDIFPSPCKGGTNCWMTTPKDWICIRHWVKYSGLIFQEKDGKGRQQLIIIDSNNESKRGNLDVTNDTNTTLSWFFGSVTEKSLSSCQNIYRFLTGFPSNSSATPEHAGQQHCLCS